ncbi:hypothetical protein [Nitrosospira briensis]|uniref:hypothetical protein n=1 Tax=Nitrosospira briensis TaxID=35799 RepID=UPI00210BF938|nr:hypothetical protein [Nitrosospira briensis]
MCGTNKKNRDSEENPGKRLFLKLAAASALGLGFAATTGRAASAIEAKAPPLPENVVTADAALERLMAGNARYVAGQSTLLDFSDERGALVTG